jgi:hypothetical protein
MSAKIIQLIEEYIINAKKTKGETRSFPEID